MALRSEEIDIAFYCSHMASHLIEDTRFMIYAPVIMNSDVLIYSITDMEQISHIASAKAGNTCQRWCRKPIRRSRKSQKSVQGFCYSLETGQIDAAVMDITKAVLVPGTSIAPISDEDYISYVLVVRKDVVDTDPFRKFVDAYNKTVRELSRTGKFSEDINAGGVLPDSVHIKFLEI